MKLIAWCVDSLRRLREFPEVARRKAGQQLNRVQHGFEPPDWKPMPSVGSGDAQETQVMTARMNERLKVRRGSGNVFRDLGFGEREARSLLIRAELALCIEDFVKRSGLTQIAAAKQLRLTQPRLNALLKGKIELFSLDALVNIATHAGLRVELKVRKAA